MMIEYLLGLLILIFPSVVAWGFIEVLDCQRVLTVLEKLPLAYLFGLGIVAWEMLVLQLLGNRSVLWLLLLSILLVSPSEGRGPKVAPESLVQERWSKVDISC
jgi:hypothetical protein